MTGGRGDLYIGVFYEGPWEHLMNRLWAIDPETMEIRREVRPGSLRDRLACFCDRRDAAWRAKWARQWRKPPARWKRRTHGTGGTQPLPARGDDPAG